VVSGSICLLGVTIRRWGRDSETERWGWRLLESGGSAQQYRLSLGPVNSSDVVARDWSVWIEIWPFEYEFDCLNWKLAVFNR
jgi:hypothetical protein